MQCICLLKMGVSLFILKMNTVDTSRVVAVENESITAICIIDESRISYATESGKIRVLFQLNVNSLDLQQSLRYSE